MASALKADINEAARCERYSKLSLAEVARPVFAPGYRACPGPGILHFDKYVFKRVPIPVYDSATRSEH